MNASTTLNPEERASILSRATFWWIVPYLKKLRRPGLELQELVDTRAADAPEVLASEYREVPSGLLSSLVLLSSRALFIAGVFTLGVIVTSIFIPLVFRWFILELTANPLLPNALITPVMLLGILYFLQGLAAHQMFFFVLRATQRTRTILPFLMYQKLLRFSYSSQLQYPAGKVVNLFATDVNRIAWAFNLVFSLLLHPIQIVTSCAVLYYLIGPAGLIGSALLSISLGLSLVVSKWQSRIKKHALAIADQRVALTTELIQAITLIKLYGWEQPVLRQVQKLRLDEARTLRLSALLEGANALIFGFAPLLFLLGSLGWLYHTGTAFSLAELLPALSTLGALRFALSALPGSIQAFIDARVSAARIENFLKEAECMPPEVPSDSSIVLEARDVTALWPSKATAIQGINIKLAPGEIVGIYGAVGAGKTAALLALHGELTRAHGLLYADRERAFVPQNPWIISDTVRNNILMGAPFDANWYARVVDASGLDQDIELFAQGDLTVVGERGVTLSGGQRQRLALARAVYARPRLLLLDDPLSALDPAVAEKVFRSLLKECARDMGIVLVTHRYEFLPRCDRTYHISQRTWSEPQQLPDERELLAYETAEAIESGEKQEDSASAVDAEERFIGAIRRVTTQRYLHRFAAGGWGMFLILLFIGREVTGAGIDYWVTLLAQGVPWVTEHALIGLIGIGATATVLLATRLVLVMVRGISLSTRYHGELLRGVIYSPIQFFSANPVGRIVNRFSRDLSNLDDLVPRMLHDCVGSSVSALVVATILLWVSPLLLVALIPVLAVYYWAQGMYRPASRECQRLDSLTRSPILSLVSESAAGIVSIRGSAAHPVLIARMSLAAHHNARALYNLYACNRWLGLVVETLSACLILAAFTSSIFAVGTISLGLVGLGLTLVLAINGTLNWAIRSLSMLEAGLTSAERIEYYAELPAEESLSLTDAHPVPPQWPSQGAISFQAVDLAYRQDAPPIVRDFSLTVTPGERVAIVGRTGSGKSTLLLGLFRAIELRRGSVIIDGIDTSFIPRTVLRERLGYLPQEPVVLSGTVRENLDPFDHYTDDQIWEVLEWSELATFVRAQSEGLRFKVREGGVNLSHGQRQLLCLARVLLKRPQIVVLDEATASVDPATDERIQLVLRQRLQGATILAIAHRIETVADYDQIVVMDQGRISFRGPPQEVLGRRTV